MTGYGVKPGLSSMWRYILSWEYFKVSFSFIFSLLNPTLEEIIYVLGRARGEALEINTCKTFTRVAYK